MEIKNIRANTIWGGDINDAKMTYYIDINDKPSMDKFYREGPEEIEIVVPNAKHKSWIDGRK